MDLSTLLPLDEITVAINDPKGKPTDITFTMAGPAHPATLTVDRVLADAALKSRDTGDKSITDIMADSESELVGRTLGWSNVQWQGAEFPFSTDNARTLYANPALAWLRNQVTKSLRDVNLFFPA